MTNRNDPTDYAAYWFSVYERAYKSGKELWRPNRAVPPNLLDFLALPFVPKPPADVIEAGCSDGLCCLMLAKMGYKCLGVDVVPIAIQRAKKMAAKCKAKNVRFVCDDLLTFSNDKKCISDLWIDIKTLHTLWTDRDRSRYFKNVHRLLRPEGFLYLNCGLALCDVRIHFPRYFAGLNQQLQTDADLLDRHLPRRKREGVRCEPLEFYCEECEKHGFEVMRAGRLVGPHEGHGAVVIARARNIRQKRKRLSVVPKTQIRVYPLVRKYVTAGQTSRIETEECWVWNTRAYEADIFGVHVSSGESGKSVKAVVKLFKKQEGLPLRTRAKIHQVLHENGVPAPRVLAVDEARRLLLLEQFGEWSLGDLLDARPCEAVGLWPLVVRRLAELHCVLSKLASHVSFRGTPEWRFEPSDRLSWALDGLKTWSAHLRLPNSDRRRWTGQVEQLCERLECFDARQTLIWGDCNPKNVLVNGNDVAFTDFHIKRSTVVMDLVMLLAFADTSNKYVPRAQAGPYLEQYWLGLGSSHAWAPSLESLAEWYDAELIWRILVYGSKIVAERAKRAADWRQISALMRQDMISYMNCPR